MHDIDLHIETGLGIKIGLNAGENFISIFGTGDKAAEAKRELQGILCHYFIDQCFLVHFPEAAMTDICGFNDSNIIRMQRDDCTVEVDKAYMRVWVCGSAKLARMHADRINSRLQHWLTENFQIAVEDRAAIGWIIGPRGEKINRLQRNTGATITTHEDIITISSKDQKTLQAGTVAVEDELEAFYRQGPRHTDAHRKGQLKEDGSIPYHTFYKKLVKEHAATAVYHK
eukprot:GHVO01018382.1.p1 GENE.GHVO01018382.1~~GHVO01018382.1.p1  ORF type:complete len:252 (-),score=32.41 GHVO01018382.1:852-1535(-)